MEITIVFMLALFLLFSGNSANTQTNPRPKDNSKTSYQRNIQPTTSSVIDRESAIKLQPTLPKTNYTNYDQLDLTYRHLDQERVFHVALHYNKYLTNRELQQIYKTTDQMCQEKNIDPSLILAIIARESSFKPTAVSPSGAKGLGQIMEFNYPGLGIKNPYNIEENIRGTVCYFQQKLLDFQNEPRQLKLALAAYKEGSGAVKRAGNSYSEHTAEYIADILKIRSQI